VSPQTSNALFQFALLRLIQIQNRTHFEVRFAEMCFVMNKNSAVKYVSTIKSRPCLYGLAELPYNANLRKHHSGRFDCSEGRPETYKCYMCSFETDLLININEHVRNDHIAGSGVECKNDRDTKGFDPFTQRKFNRKDLLDTFNCNNCEFKTVSQMMLMKHFYNECKDNLIFEYAEHLFKSKYENNMKRDYSSVHVKWFVCKQCLYKTKVNINMKKHILAEHTAPESNPCFKCDWCKFRTKWVYDLMMHKLVHCTKTRNAPWFDCEQCGYKTAKMSEMKRHILIKHLDFTN
jgi:hypothetical protein